MTTAEQVLCENHRPMLIAYMQAKMEAEDWHGVMDAAADLREIDAQLRGHRESDVYWTKYITKYISDNHNARMAGQHLTTSTRPGEEMGRGEPMASVRPVVGSADLLADREEAARLLVSARESEAYGRSGQGGTPCIP